MSELVANCPRCGAKNMTFSVMTSWLIEKKYDWQNWVQAFCICRGCRRSTVFVLSQKDAGVANESAVKGGIENWKFAVNNFMEIENYICIRDMAAKVPPEHIPEKIAFIFREGAACMSIGCYNAAGTMFRLCIDLSTRALLPEGDPNGLNSKTRRDLGLRLPWLFEMGLLPKELKDLSSCVKEDGNDGAHEGTLGKEDAEDLLDFTYAFLERMYTEPKKLKIADEKRRARRESKH